MFNVDGFKVQTCYLPLSNNVLMKNTTGDAAMPEASSPDNPRQRWRLQGFLVFSTKLVSMPRILN